MKKKQRTIKRALVKEIRRPHASVDRDGTNQIDDPDCTGTPVVYCNQWECYSHDLCISDGLRTENRAVISGSK